MKILLAVDGSKYALAAVRQCCEIITADDDLEIRIISVADISAPIGMEPFGISGDFNLSINQEMKKFADKAVDEAKNIVSHNYGDSIKIETEVLSGSPKSIIVDEAESWNADLIVVGSHGYGFFERMLIGSVSNAILHHAPCSVLVVKIKDTDSSE